MDAFRLFRHEIHRVVASPCFSTRAERRGRQTAPRLRLGFLVVRLGWQPTALAASYKPFTRVASRSGNSSTIQGAFFQGVAVCGVCWRTGSLLIGSGRCLLHGTPFQLFESWEFQWEFGQVYSWIPRRRRIGSCPWQAEARRRPRGPHRLTLAGLRRRGKRKSIHPYTPESDIHPMGCLPAHYRAFQRPCSPVLHGPLHRGKGQ